MSEIVENVIVLTLLALLFILACSGCDGEYARLQREAEFNQRLAHAAMPKYGEPRVCAWVGDSLICWTQGRKRQPTVVANREDIP